MPRLIFANRYFFPDHSATSQVLSDLAFDLAASGRAVHVVTSRQIYDNPKASLPPSEIVNGVTVHRVASTRFGRRGLFGRAVDYVSFSRSVRRCLGDIARPDDIVIAKTDPPLLGVIAMDAVRGRGARLVNWMQDIYPETAMELDVPLMRGPVAAALAALRNRSVWQSEATVVVGDLMAKRIEGFGAAPARIRVIPNWCNDEAIKPLLPGDNPLRQSWGLAGQFVVGYSGNLGRAHDFGTVLAAAERFRGDARIVFLTIGGGKGFDALANAVKARGLDALFRFMPYQDQATLPRSLSLPDVHWLSLNPKLEGLIVPSKFYGIAAAGKPIVAIADGGGEISRLVTQYDCGVVIAPGDSESLFAALQRLRASPDLIAAMGRRARQMLEMQFTRREGLSRWHALLDSLDAGPQPGGAGGA